MPDTRKKKNVSSKAGHPKHLRQATLFESITTPSSPKSSNTSLHQLITPRRSKRGYISESSESSDIGAIRLEPITPARKASDTGDRSQSPLPSRAKRRRVIVVESGSEDKEEQQSSSPQSDVAAKTRQRRLRRRASTSSEDESPRRNHIPSKGKTKQVELDDEDLSDELDKDRIIESRLRTRGKKTAFQKNLEKLKRKKMGKPMSPSESSEENKADGDGDQLKPFKGAIPSSNDVDSLFDERDSDSDGSSSFIVEDDSQAVAAELPSEFSMRSHDDLSHQFKIIFQLFVHITVSPIVNRHAFMEDQLKNQEYFSFPLKVTRRKLSGLRDSLVASSVWRPKFKKALGKYPTFELIPLDFAVPSCDACHLGGRFSTLMGRLGGIPYDKLGFMDQIASDSGDGSEESVTHLKKSKFGFLEFHLGRFCARRVRIYHEFLHWEYHLFNTIRSELDNLHAANSNHGFVRVAYAGGKQPPSDFTDADGICEWLDERGIIDQEWHKMKTMMESAHHLEVSAKKGEED
ncbi:hypothetical protein P691DRAFT_716911 [Macrolepiota fuliginosa MF-IS2]|uniref:DUF4211 domain-containing protein n=1 Tax=Macrolepiota fuliginosa MF-IS2 TaxID=1400762 RepID=A0A9P5XPU0_9AGAR|nr:hypothetical protein P691DRAFT_716911 [Macrolepiota fuliginosa MF-IS2]